MTRLSENFSLAEFTSSDTADARGIENTPDDSQIENLRYLVTAVLQPLRTFLGVPVRISSGFRNRELNKAVGGVEDSHHLAENQFAAADISAGGMPASDVMAAIGELGLPVEQVINEFDKWVHVSSRRPKKEFLRAFKSDGRTAYEAAGNTTPVV